MTKNRDKIPENIRRKIWAESAGRCQFRGCPEQLWRNSLTGKITPFGEIAHIIGASRKGPRGRWDSVALQTDSNNLMMLCERCHKEIDYGKNIKDYPVTLLKEMKKEHEERIRLLLDTPRNKTTVLIFSCPIQGRLVSIPNESVYKAVLPDYPDSSAESWHKIEIPNFNYNLTSWEYVKSEINKEFEDLNRKAKNGEINNISIFGLAPIPLLFYLGYKFGDTIPGEVFHARRDVPSEDRFVWIKSSKSDFVDYKTELIRNTKSKKVLLILALSDYVESDKYNSIIDDEFSIYKLSIDNPSPLFLTRKSELESFKHKFRILLNEIQRDHGVDCTIDILGAIPASIAITAGRIIIPTKDPKITIYEFSDLSKISIN